MNLIKLARDWLIDHGFDERSSGFKEDLLSLSSLLTKIEIGYESDVDKLSYNPSLYDPKFGDDKVCKCGHSYYRHFDTYDHMSPIGCKYCSYYDEETYHSGHCAGFKFDEG